MIEIKNLTVAFADKIVLENIDLTISENLTTIIVGESGSGKSVLAKTVEGLIKPIGGTVLIDDIDIFSLKRKKLYEVRHKLAMLFQGSALLDSLNVFQNVALPLSENTSLSKNEIIRKVKNTLVLVGLKDILTKMPAELSGGMKKRVALARAVILQPKYIIYDEPTTGLDPNISGEIVNLMINLQKKIKLTSIVITHDLNCIEKMAEKIVMLDRKKIIFDGSFSDFKKAEKIEIKKFLNGY